MQQQKKIQKTEHRRGSRPRPAKVPQKARATEHPSGRLQRIIGNHGVLRLAGHTVQPKLRIGAPNDKYEQEADRVAEKVMRMAEPEVERQEEQEEEENLIQTNPMAPEITPLVQRKEEEEEENSTIQAKSMADRDSTVSRGVTTNIPALYSGGRPLSVSQRSFFERRFGYDFGRVRIHTDVRASKAARDMNAQAFTVGRDIVFGSGRYSAVTTDGQRLLAHELTHIVQQGFSKPKSAKSKTSLYFYGHEECRKSMTLRGTTQAKHDGKKEYSQNGVFPSLVQQGCGVRVQRLIGGPVVKDDPTAREARMRIAAAKQLGKQLGPKAQKSLRPYISRAENALASYRRTVGQTSALMNPAGGTVQVGVGPGAIAQAVIAALALFIGWLFASQASRRPQDRAAAKRLAATLMALQLHLEALRRLQKEQKSRQRLKRVGPSGAPPYEPGNRRRHRRGYYPLCWPLILHWPQKQTTFIRVKSPDRDYKGDNQKALKAKRQREVGDPDFRSKAYHIHHAVPLFLGGEDKLQSPSKGGNGVILPALQHIKGHTWLQHQPQMERPPPPLRPLDKNIYKHSLLTKYYLAGFKNSKEEIC